MNSNLVVGNLKKIPDADLIKFLKKPFVRNQTVSYCFCSKCQTLGEIDLDYAQSLVRTMGLLGNRPEIPLEKAADFVNYYFVIGYCEICGIGPLSVHMKKLVN